MSTFQLLEIFLLLLIFCSATTFLELLYNFTSTLPLFLLHCLCLTAFLLSTSFFFLRLSRLFTSFSNLFSLTSRTSPQFVGSLTSQDREQNKFNKLITWIKQLNERNKTSACSDRPLTTAAPPANLGNLHPHSRRYISLLFPQLGRPACYPPRMTPPKNLGTLGTTALSDLRSLMFD